MMTLIVYQHADGQYLRNGLCQQDLLVGEDLQAGNEIAFPWEGMQEEVPRYSVQGIVDSHLLLHENETLEVNVLFVRSLVPVN
jgi:hypothetical protein